MKKGQGKCTRDRETLMEVYGHFVGSGIQNFSTTPDTISHYLTCITNTII